MKSSMRAKRMAKHHRRNKTVGKLNLVSLMDIFTILVFFLLVNSGEIEVLEVDTSVVLPDSIAEERPDEGTLVIRISLDNIIIDGKEIVSIKDIDATTPTILPLSEELKTLMAKTPLNEKEKKNGRAVTLLGHKDIPYELLQRIMATCAEQNYRAIYFGVNKKLEGAS